MSLTEDLISFSVMKVLDEKGFGASKNKRILLDNIPIKDVKKIIFFFTKENKWPLEKEVVSNESEILIFQIGQWGLSISGSQRLGVIIYKRNNKTILDLISRSTMGQVVDWGANKKNLQKFENFLNKVLSNPSLKTDILSSRIEKIRNKPTINPKFWLLHLSITLIALLILFILILIGIF